MIEDCEAFQAANVADLAEMADSRAGFCFWLNRNGHGSGFWDEDTIPNDVGERLSEACEDFGECNLYVGDDRQIHC